MSPELERGVAELRRGIANAFGRDTQIRLVEATPDAAFATLEFAAPSRRLEFSFLELVIGFVDDATRRLIESVKIRFPLASQRETLRVAIRLRSEPSEVSYTRFDYEEFRSVVKFDVEKLMQLTTTQQRALKAIIVYVVNMRRNVDSLSIAVSVETPYDVDLDIESVSEIDYAFLLALRARFVGVIDKMTFDGSMDANNRMRLHLTTLDFDPAQIAATRQSSEKKRVRETSDDEAKQVPSKSGGFLSRLFGT